MKNIERKIQILDNLGFTHSSSGTYHRFMDKGYYIIVNFLPMNDSFSVYVSTDKHNITTIQLFTTDDWSKFEQFYVLVE